MFSLYFFLILHLHYKTNSSNRYHLFINSRTSFNRLPNNKHYISHKSRSTSTLTFAINSIPLSKNAQFAFSSVCDSEKIGGCLSLPPTRTTNKRRNNINKKATTTTNKKINKISIYGSIFVVYFHTLPGLHRQIKYDACL